jgi:signal transduction histidine kinase
LSLVAPERVQFRYQLAGEDDGWVWAGTRRFAHYGSLRPGNYQFRVTACNSDGVWNAAGAALDIRILPRFYETRWFQAGSALAVLGAVFGAVRHRYRVKFRRHAEQLERRNALERERARIAKDIHDDLGSTLTLIAVQGDLAKERGDPERIAKVSSTARQAIKSLDEIVWAVNPRNDSLGQLLDYAGQYALDYLRAAGVRCRLDIPERVPERELPSKVRYNVFLALKEALQNVVKHAHATDAWVQVAVLPDGVRLELRDNGCGFASAPDDALADGLRNMRQRLEAIGGRCTIESRVGTGTQVRFEFPWPSD